MKKVLSVLLALSMLLSFAPMTMAAVEVSTATKNENGFSFTFEKESDFSHPDMMFDSNSAAFKTEGVTRYYTPGANGSKGAVANHVEVSANDDGLTGNGVSQITLTPGQEYEISMDIKMISAENLQRRPNVHIFFMVHDISKVYGDPEGLTPGPSNYYYFTETIPGETVFSLNDDGSVSDEWAHLTHTFTAPQKYGSGYIKNGESAKVYMFVRFGVSMHGIKGCHADFKKEFIDSCPTVESGRNAGEKGIWLDYAIDNVEMRQASLKVESEEEEEESPYLWDVNFEDNGWYSEVEGANVGVTFASSKEIVQDVPQEIADTSKSALKWSYAGNTGNGGYTDFDVTVNSNKTKLWFNRVYEISFWAKGSEAAAAFHAANTGRVTTIIPERSDNARLDKTFPMWTGFNTSDLITTEWKKYTYLYYEEMPAALSAAAENPFNLKFHLRFQCVPGKLSNDLTAADGTAYAWSDGTNNYALNDFQFYVDDFRVKPLDIVYNGDFTKLSGAADYNSIWYNGATNKYTSKMGEDVLSSFVFHNGEIVEAADGNYLSVTENAGAPYQGVNVEKGTPYTISFKVRAADPAFVGKPVNVVLDRDIKGEVLDNSQYTFTNIPKWVGYRFDTAQAADVVLNTEGYDGYGAPTGVTGSVPFYMYGGVVTNGHHPAGILKPVANNETLIYDEYYDRMFSKNTQAGKAPTAWGYQYYDGTEWVGTNDILDATSTLTLTEDWTEYTIEYQWNYEGKHYRLPKLTFLDDASYDLKDIQIIEGEVLDPNALPAFHVDNLRATGKNVLTSSDKITLTWDFVSTGDRDTEEAPGAIVKVYAYTPNGYALIGTTIADKAGKADVAANAEMFDKELWFEVIPKDINGYFGTSQMTVFNGTVALAVETSLTEGADHNSVDFDISVQSAGESGKAFGYVALYKDNKLVGITDASIDYQDGDNETHGNVLMANGANKAKLLVWDKDLSPLSKEQVVELFDVNAAPFAGDTEINVVYLGDSIYEGAGASAQSERWVNQVGAWFTETYAKDGVTVNNHYKGVGGTTTEYSLMRLQRDVIANNPDVVFISATCNDGGRDVTFNLESMVRTLQSLDNPPYIVLTRTTNRNYSTSFGYVEKVAEFYNLPLIDDRDAFIRATTPNTDVPIADLFISDGVHPSDAGYDVITDEIVSCMETGRYYHKGTERTDKLYAGSGILKDVETFNPTDASKVTLTGNWTNDGSRVFIEESDATLSFSFTGNAFGFLYGLNHYGASAEIYIDGKLVKTGNLHYNNITGYQYVFKEHSSVFELDYGTHDVEIKIKPGVNAVAEGSTTIKSAIGTFFTGTIE